MRLVIELSETEYARLQRATSDRSRVVCQPVDVAVVRQADGRASKVFEVGYVESLGSFAALDQGIDTNGPVIRAWLRPRGKEH
jgi:hypothetical protein